MDDHGRFEKKGNNLLQGYTTAHLVRHSAFHLARHLALRLAQFPELHSAYPLVYHSVQHLQSVNGSRKMKQRTWHRSESGRQDHKTATAVYSETTGRLVVEQTE